MWRQIQLPGVLHCNCHVKATAVALLVQLQVPCGCRMRNAAWKQKMQVTCYSKSKYKCIERYSCHVRTSTVAMLYQLQLPCGCRMENTAWQQKCRWHGAANPVAMSSHNSCHHRWEPQKNCLGQKSDYTDVYKKMISAEEMYLGRSALRTWKPSYPRPLAVPSLQPCLPGKQRQLA